MDTWNNQELQQKELSKAKKRVETNQLFWKPVLYGVLTYTEACECDMDTLLEANIIAEIKSGNII